jgi:hypothetical protein
LFLIVFDWQSLFGSAICPEMGYTVGCRVLQNGTFIGENDDKHMGELWNYYLVFGQTRSEKLLKTI